MPKVNAYLECQSREQAEKLWWQRLTAIGYFDSLPAEEILIDDSLGRVTESSVYARQSVPHYNGAAMDGIAVRAQDTFGAGETTPKKLKLLKPGEQFATGSCYIVDTGDLLPAGTNAVIMVEDIHIADGYAQIIAAATPWQHVRIIGEDIADNEIVLPEHHLISPPDIAALLAAGLEKVKVLVTPRVTVIPTGTELVNSFDQLQPGAILDVNSHMLCAAMAAWGGRPNRHPIIPDDYERLKAAVAASLKTSDMVITNAGTSAGTEDFTSRVLGELGEVLVHGVAIRPGKPVVLAICQGKPVIGLPGYPVSAMLTAELFVKPVLLARQKLSAPPEKIIPAFMVRQVYSNIGTEEYLRVTVANVKGRTVAAPLGRGAGLISSLTKAQGMVVIDREKSGLPAGAEVEVRLLGNCRPENNILSVGSHDLALDVLGIFLKRRLGLELSCANVGSMGGVMAIRNNEAHIAGVHILDASGEYNIPCLRKYLADRSWLLVHMAMREQGLIVRPGNPKNIRNITDLTRPDILYVNRQRGAGTRMLLDYRLTKLGIVSDAIDGYEKEVGTHMAVAATVAEGAADAGMGIRAAAQALGLEFIPVANERYDLIFNFAEQDKRAAVIIDILKTPAFRQEVERLGGYDLAESGGILAVNK